MTQEITGKCRNTTNKASKSYTLITIFTKPKYKIGKNKKIPILSQISDDTFVVGRFIMLRFPLSYLLTALI